MYIIDKNGNYIFGFSSLEGVGISGEHFLIFVPYDDEQKQIAKEMTEIKQKLSDTDYKVIKYLEGLISAEDYNSIHEQREKWRKKYNDLESKFKEPSLNKKEIEAAEKKALEHSYIEGTGAK